MMETFLTFVAEIMDTDPTEISLETEYGQYEKWDSLMMLTLVMELEAEYDVSIPMESIGEIKTLRDLWLLVGGKA